MKRWGVLFLAPWILIGCFGGSSHRTSTDQPTTRPAPASTPVLAVISTDKTMTANGGDGVGVFVEYKAGGLWHVWWTCDTNKSAQTCNFDVRVSSPSGLKNVRSEGLLASDQAGVDTDGSACAVTNTGSNVTGIYLETAPGARVTLDASVAGVAKTGDYIFFVAQNAKGQDTINGDYMGVLTNPLWLQPSSP